MLLAAIFACSAAILVEGLKASKKRRHSDLEPAAPAVAQEVKCDGSELMSDSDGGSGGTGSGTSGERLSWSAVPVLHTLTGTM
jgi:hypothetical protein